MRNDTDEQKPTDPKPTLKGDGTTPADADSETTLGPTPQKTGGHPRLMGEGPPHPNNN